MQIRPYLPGDDEAQASIFNIAAAALPAFKPATAEEVARRYRATDIYPTRRLFAVDEKTGIAVGYASYNPNGRVSYPWCLPGFKTEQEMLFIAMSASLLARGRAEAWTAYRTDWTPVLAFFQANEFVPDREMINYIAETASLPATPATKGLALGTLDRADLPRLLELGCGLFDGGEPEHLSHFLWGNPWFGPDSLFAIRADGGQGAVVGAATAIATPGYADPVKVDAAMPCFRLGAFGTERERHKRVNGLVSCVFTDEAIGEALLAEAARRFKAAGLVHASAQVPSDRPELVAFYERFFRRQGSFPILTRRLSAAGPPSRPAGSL